MQTYEEFSAEMRKISKEDIDEFVEICRTLTKESTECLTLNPTTNETPIEDYPYIDRLLMDNEDLSLRVLINDNDEIYKKYRRGLTHSQTISNNPEVLSTMKEETRQNIYENLKTLEPFNRLVILDFFEPLDKEDLEEGMIDNADLTGEDFEEYRLEAIQLLESYNI